VTFVEGLGPLGEIQDVKFRDDLRENWAHLKPRLRAACQYARGNGKIYRLRSEVEIRDDFLPQATFLYRFLRHVEPVERYLSCFREALETDRVGTPDSLLTSCFRETERADALPTLWYMVANRQIRANLNRPLTMLTELWLDEAIGETGH
jgi:hypothetical protein